MDILMVVKNSKDASAEKNAGRNYRTGFMTSGIRAFSLLAVTVSLALSPSTVNAAGSPKDLQKEIDRLISAIAIERVQAVQVINAIYAAIAPPQSLTIGTIEGIRGTAVNLPVYFQAASTAPISGLQFDVGLSTGITVLEVTSGIATQAANKSTQGAATPTGYKTIIFGLNPATIQSGPVAILKLNIAANVTPGKKTLPISGMVGASATGFSIPISGTNGSLSIR